MITEEWTIKKWLINFLWWFGGASVALLISMGLVKLLEYILWGN